MKHYTKQLYFKQSSVLFIRVRTCAFQKEEKNKYTHSVWTTSCNDKSKVKSNDVKTVMCWCFLQYKSEGRN